MRNNFLRRLNCAGAFLWLAALAPGCIRADSWELPRDEVYHSENGSFEFFVAVPDLQKSKQESSGTLRRKRNDQWEEVWHRKLVNQTCPVRSLVTDSGRYVVTFDEHHAVGKNPVVIYGAGGVLITNLTLSALNLEAHPRIAQSVSSYWWNEAAIIVFGPPAHGGETWQRTLEDSLFIRLYWGEVIVIDLASGAVRNDKWWKARGGSAQSNRLKKATTDYLDGTWRRLARDYLRKENFDPDPSEKGVKGILLAGQLRLPEGLPLLREIAASERFKSWAAPRWKTNHFNHVQNLARAAIAEIE